MSDSEVFSMEEDSVGAEDESFGEAVSSDDEENFVPPTKNKAAPVKKTAPVKKAAPVNKGKSEGSVSVLSESNVNIPKPSSEGNGGKTKTVEEIYQKKTQLEHILLRPDTYIGSVEPHTQRMYVLDSDTGKIVEREITFTPGLFKIFDEIVVNAADNKQRDSNMDRMDIDIDGANNTLSVRNNGKGIPIVMHKEHNVYVPELIFGHLLTGSNFDDNEKKTTGGRNGYGAKLANVFSTRFTVECVDVGSGLFYCQTFTKNMTDKGKPIVKNLTKAQEKKGDYVQITFSPELARFQMESLDTDTVGLLSRRAYDIAGTMSNSAGKKLCVFLNGEKIAVKNWIEYLDRFDGIAKPVAYEKTDRWEVAVAASADSTMRHVSFVNAISTSKGGGHVSYIADQVAAHLQKTLKKKNKGTEVKPAQIKNHLSIYVNCLVENPAFDSQTKEFLTTKAKSFGSICKLSDIFLKKIDKSDIVGTILAYANFKDRQALQRKGGAKKTKLTGIAKLDDANYAGTAKSLDCTLIVTEGDSAKSLAVSGLSVIGRDLYGVFPLRGKPLNVRDATLAAVTKNEEIKNLVDILGLKYGKAYDSDADLKTLRYGHLMVMADQDVDGSHIKGLIINFLHHFWPKLLDRPGFLQQFITPIVKANKAKKSITFFNLPEFNSWLESTNGGKGWTTKYYKGLGTSTSAEAKEYFSNLDIHEISFAPLESDKIEPNEEDELSKILPDLAPSGSDMIDMVFRRDRVEDRKIWLNTTCMDAFLDYSTRSSNGVKYSEFINKEYILFSRYDNVRSIPHLLDGFKPSQRKVLFACFKRKLKSEVKVAQLTGYIAEHSAYHHGEVSLQGAIVNMAQNFCGSNNLNLLTPSGQFGTRRMGGKDAASARYIFTKLEAITRMIFHPDDDDLLNYLTDDGESIEPEYYVPVIPMILVNGSEGIGTGWSTNVNNHDPRDIVANLRRKLNGEEFQPMAPYYYGFVGEIAPDSAKKDGTFSANGKIERISDTVVEITELPIRKWTQDYKIFLEKLLTGEVGKTDPEIKDFKEGHTDTTVFFTITCDKEKLDAYEQEKNGLLFRFKLTGSLQSSNMNLFAEGLIKKFDETRDILNAFFEVRLRYYEMRKVRLVEKLRIEQRKLSNKARFVEEVCSGELVVSNRKRKDILTDLQTRGYDTFLPDAKDKVESEEEEQDVGDETMSDAELAKGYEYLLGMKIWSLTYEKAEQIRAELAEKTRTLEILEATSPSQIWLNDLDAIEEALNQRDEEFKAAHNEEMKAQKKTQKRQARVRKEKKGKKKADAWDSEEESSSEDEIMDEDDEDNEAPTKRKPAPKKQPVKKVVVPPSQSTITRHFAPKSAAESAVHDPVGTTLANTMKVNLHVSVPPQNPSAEETKKRLPSPVLNDAESDKDDKMDQGDVIMEKENVVKKAPAMKKTVPAAKKTAVPAIKKATAAAGRKTTAAAAAKKKAPPKKTIVVDSSESEDDMDFHSEGEEEEAPAPEAKSTAASRARSARARKPIVYALDDSDASEEESDDSF